MVLLVVSCIGLFVCVGERLVEMRITPHGVPILGREKKEKYEKEIKL